MNAKEQTIRAYMSEIGRRGGEKSRRRLSSAQAHHMVRVREARKAYRKYYSQCFWYMRKDRQIGLEDIPQIVRGLRKYGGREGFLLAAKLCR